MRAGQKPAPSKVARYVLAGMAWSPSDYTKMPGTPG